GVMPRSLCVSTTGVGVPPVRPADVPVRLVPVRARDVLLREAVLRVERAAVRRVEPAAPVRRVLLVRLVVARAPVRPEELRRAPVERLAAVGRVPVVRLAAVRRVPVERLAVVRFAAVRRVPVERLAVERLAVERLAAVRRVPVERLAVVRFAAVRRVPVERERAVVLRPVVERRVVPLLERVLELVLLRAVAMCLLLLGEFGGNNVPCSMRVAPAVIQQERHHSYLEMSSTTSPVCASDAFRATSACATMPTSVPSSSTTGSRRTW